MIILAITYYHLLYVWIAIAIIVLPTAIVQVAPYGRHTRGGWGFLMDNKLGWILMELPALLVIPLMLMLYPRDHSLPAMILMGLYWLSDPRFIIGGIVFFLGVFINVKSDSMLINLRKPGERGYKIPKGFLFRYVSCPNHLGEIVEWIGFGIMAWALPVFSFSIWTAANLIPRTLNHHTWYKEKFEDYPKERKAVIPFLL